MTSDGVARIAAGIYYYTGESEIRSGRLLISNDLFYRLDDGRGGASYYSSRGASFCCSAKDETGILSQGMLAKLFTGDVSEKDIADVLEIMRRQALFMDAARYALTERGAAAIYDLANGHAVLSHDGGGYILQAIQGMIQDDLGPVTYGDFNPDGTPVDFIGAWELSFADRPVRELDSNIGRMKSVIARIMGITADREVYRMNGFDLLSGDVEHAGGLFYGSAY